MSLSHFLPAEFRPFFGEHIDHYGYPVSRSRQSGPSSQLWRSMSVTPAVDVNETEQGYVVHAEIPNVKKENIEVNIGDGGRSLNISGHVSIRRGPTEQAATPRTPVEQSTSEKIDPSSGSESVPALAKEDQTSADAKDTSSKVINKLHSERTFVAETSFSRTVHFPRPVDASTVTAKLADGVLEINLRKVENTSTKVAIN